MIIINITNNEFEKIQTIINNCNEYVTTYLLYAYWILSNYYNKTCKVAEDKSKIIGFISGLPSIENKIIFIWQLCVLKKYRNKKIASALINNIIKEAKKICYQIEFTISSSNTASINLFTKYAEQNNIKMKLLNEIKFNNSKELLYRYKL